MSTFVEIIPTQHATIQVTGIRIDEDFHVTVRTETGGVATDNRFNFTGLLEGQAFDGTSPIGQVRASKIGTQARVVIQVYAYYAPDKEDSVPVSGLYWYNTKNQYRFGGPFEVGKTEAADPAFNTPQSLPVTIFNQSSLAAWSSGNSANTSVPSSLYGQLGNLTARRNYLKGRILRNINHPTLPMWIAGGGISAKDDTDVSELLVHVQRLQAIPYWLEMLTGAISVDANLATEQKFNLLEGEAGLSVLEVLQKTGTTFAHNIDGSGNRDTFTFRSLGSVASSSPWKYTAPSGGTWADSDASSTISMSGSQAGAGIDWVSWLRSL